MGVHLLFHMNEGQGDTSYARNSIIQKKIISVARETTKEAILDLYCAIKPERLSIADLGCSSGPNALQQISDIIDFVYQKCRQLGHPSPEFQCFLNDLPSNDFNTVFYSLPEFYEKLRREKGTDFGPCFVFGVPGSFYERLFTKRSLHFVLSSSSLHWLSQVPVDLDSGRRTSPHLNKGKLYISKTSPPCVLRSYLQQFQCDFLAFLASRSQEIIAGGRMVLTLMGRRSGDPADHEEYCFQWELLSNALMDMVSEGLIEEEKVDSLNSPYYSPSPEELNQVVQSEGSFTVDRLENFEVEFNASLNGTDDNNESKGHRVAKSMRAVVEPMLDGHFGGKVMDDLFYRYGVHLQEYISQKRPKLTNLLVSMVRNG
ncbi:Jasmonate O-methyltransferase [Acorus calamus]|uniref:Jasmonate O-methyltransferase n=1 Tax=Acorus calamus TaxID=4465 RepID=A0AAV9DLK6_ACOCL|nr:Jasmonate O-methyltransferase [Acorus calamus]